MLMHWFLSAIFLELKILFNKFVSVYPSLKQFVSKCYKTQQIYDKVVNTCFLFDSLPD